jgi:hypothetical protein
MVLIRELNQNNVTLEIEVSNGFNVIIYINPICLVVFLYKKINPIFSFVKVILDGT